MRSQRRVFFEDNEIILDEILDNITDDIVEDDDSDVNELLSFLENDEFETSELMPLD